MVDKIRQQRWKIILNVITFGALIGLCYGLRQQIFETIRGIKDVNYWALMLIPFVQLSNYHAQTKLYQSFFHILGTRIPYRFMYRTAMELNFVNTVFPSGGVSGFSYISLRLRSRGIRAGQATVVQMMRFIMIFVSFQIILFLGLLALAIGGRANSLMILVAGSLSTLLVVLTLIIGFVIGSEKRIDSFFTFITRLINRLIHIVRPQYPETINVARAREVFNDLHNNYIQIRSNYAQLKQPLFYSLMANLAEVGVIYLVYIAFGELVNPGAIIIAYAVANFAGLISVVPGGIGVYEALMTGVLAAGGVPPRLSLPVTVMYRVVNMTIQLIPGYFFYQRALHERAERELNDVSNPQGS